MKKISLICTTYNEEKTITLLLSALLDQSYKPAEVIICDGGSTDKTVQLIQKFATKYSSLSITLLKKKSTIGSGRNFAVKAARYSLIAITDAGCIPEKNWLEQLVACHQTTHAPVVAGFYKGIAHTAFEEAVIPYVLVMPDKLNPETFLPATRSMLIEKSVWEKLGGLNETVNASEDYIFAHQIKAARIRIAVATDAIVGWLPRKNLGQFFDMMFAFAKYDMQGGVLRTKVVLIFVRYLLLCAFSLLLIYQNKFTLLAGLLMAGAIIYSLWSIQKNIKYVKKGWYWLPVLQVSSDSALMLGSVAGLHLFYKK